MDPEAPPPERFRVLEELGRQATEVRANAVRLAEAVQRAMAATEATRQKMARPTVLVVDDEHAVRAVVGRLLVEAGYRVVLARSGPEALEAIEHLKGELDLLLSDLRMPQMDGVRLATEVRRVQPDAGILLMAAYPAEDPPQYPVLVKPFAAGELELEVGRVLGARRRPGPPPDP